MFFSRFVRSYTDYTITDQKAEFHMLFFDGLYYASSPLPDGIPLHLKSRGFHPRLNCTCFTFVCPEQRRYFHVPKA